ncbi:MAG: aminotransferase class III-fold pyridoxal phosphate-dependent enzyme, partial [Pseudomonadota bacterium]|nr:aminotransferase class III-fold pyridoxal phosphate-dependent enzyme [Pseudomonadota bacterium]
REKCTDSGALLIFDEVMTGFRVAPGGVQQVTGVLPDITTLGKVIGGGLPIGAFGGKKEIMEQIAPSGAVYQAGTLSGSPLAVAAGLAMLEAISEPNFYNELQLKARTLVEGLKERAQAAGVPFTTNQVGGMFGCFFSEEEKITTFEQVMACNMEHFQTYFHTMLENGVYLAPSAYEAGFVSSAHGDEEIDKTLDAAEKAFAAIK